MSAGEAGGVEADRDVLAEERAFLEELGAKPFHKRIWGYTGLSGPGWLQSAITLGGGSLAGALYLGVLGGFSLLWVQLVAMLLGIVMLSAIGYVTLSTGERPFGAINRHVSPVLGWGWAIATLTANMVWCLPQFSLGTAAVQQNLLPSVVGTEGVLGDTLGKVVVCAVLLGLAILVIWSYDKGKKGIRLFEGLLKVMVGVIVASFFIVVIRMAFSAKGLEWGRIFAGFLPDFRTFSRPSADLQKHIDAVAPAFQEFWTRKIVGMQRNVMITAAATAVGINMTFLLPYSMLARGWRRQHRGLATFDLGIGLLVPYILATTCVVIASATQFHAEPGAGLHGSKDKPLLLFSVEPDLQGDVDTGRLSDRFRQQFKDNEISLSDDVVVAPEDQGSLWRIVDVGAGRTYLAEKAGEALNIRAKPKLMDKYDGLAKARLKHELKEGYDALSAEQVLQRIAGLPKADKDMAARLVKRDAFDLAASLERLTGGKAFSHIIFGIGVVGMALSTIIILMLISGFVICEMLGLPPEGKARRWGSMAAAVGVLGPFIWAGKTQFWLAVPTSVFCFVLLPIAYIAFLLLMNQKKLLGDEMPAGGRRVRWNVLMGIATGLVAVGAGWTIWAKAKWVGVAAVAVFVALIVVVHLIRMSRPAGEGASADG